MLTDGARADSIPNLEIETGDIRGAGHASATGRFDDEQLFYLQSRGIREDEARRLVVLGFLSDIVQRIQSDLSRYMLTISATSVALGAATAAYLAWLGVADPLLWGVLAAALNLTPFIGPLVMAVLLGLVGLSGFDTLGQALMPAAGYLLLHALESQLFTPLVLGRTMRINPLAIILWLLLWGWLWGVAGLLVAVPMLVCLKIAAERLEGGAPWARLLE